MKKLPRFLLFAAILLVTIGDAPGVEAKVSNESRLKSIVKIYILDGRHNEKARLSGSGIVISNNRVLTAMHVVSPMARDNNRFSALVCVTRTDTDEPICALKSHHVEKYSEKYDLAIINLDEGYDSGTGNFLDWPQYIKKYDINEFVNANNFVRGNSTTNIKSGEPIEILGYPGVGGNTITLTTGVVSGFEKGDVGGQSQVMHIKTDAKINPGNSGGAAFNKDNQLIGITTAVRRDFSDLGLIVSMQAVKDFLDGRSERIQGEVCFDYINGEKIEGECVCKNDFVWDDDISICSAATKNGSDEEQEKQSEPTEQNAPSDEEPEAAANDGQSDEEDGQQDEENDVTENDEKNSVEQADDTEESKPDTMRNVMNTRLKDVIIEGIISCKKETAPGDRNQLRSCLKQKIILFVKERSQQKRALQKQCRDEGRTDIPACVREKASE